MPKGLLPKLLSKVFRRKSKKRKEAVDDSFLAAIERGAHGLVKDGDPQRDRVTVVPKGRAAPSRFRVHSTKDPAPEPQTKADSEPEPSEVPLPQSTTTKVPCLPLKESNDEHAAGCSGIDATVSSDCEAVDTTLSCALKPCSDIDMCSSGGTSIPDPDPTVEPIVLSQPSGTVDDSSTVRRSLSALSVEVPQPETNKLNVSKSDTLVLQTPTSLATAATTPSPPSLEVNKPQNHDESNVQTGKVVGGIQHDDIGVDRPDDTTSQAQFIRNDNTREIDDRVTCMIPIGNDVPDSDDPSTKPDSDPCADADRQSTNQADSTSDVSCSSPVPDPVLSRHEFKNGNVSLTSLSISPRSSRCITSWVADTNPAPSPISEQSDRVDDGDVFCSDVLTPPSSIQCISLWVSDSGADQLRNKSPDTVPEATPTLNCASTALPSSGCHGDLADDGCLAVDAKQATDESNTTSVLKSTQGCMLASDGEDNVPRIDSPDGTSVNDKLDIRSLSLTKNGQPVTSAKPSVKPKPTSKAAAGPPVVQAKPVRNDTSCPQNSPPPKQPSVLLPQSPTCPPSTVDRTSTCGQSIPAD